MNRIADGTKPDDDCIRDPVDEVLSILAASEDVPLVRKYGLWVVKRDWERGLEVSSVSPCADRSTPRVDTIFHLVLQLFTHSGLDFDHGDLVDELRALDDRAGDKYLEHVVIVKKSTVSRPLAYASHLAFRLTRTHTHQSGSRPAHIDGCSLRGRLVSLSGEPRGREGVCGRRFVPLRPETILHAAAY